MNECQILLGGPPDDPCGVAAQATVHPPHDEDMLALGAGQDVVGGQEIPVWSNRCGGTSICIGTSADPAAKPFVDVCMWGNHDCREAAGGCPVDILAWWRAFHRWRRNGPARGHRQREPRNHPTSPHLDHPARSLHGKRRMLTRIHSTASSNSLRARRSAGGMTRSSRVSTGCHASPTPALTGPATPWIRMVTR